MKVVIGTRGSKLALTQTHWVMKQLKAQHPSVVFEIKVIKTKGDIIQHISLDKIGDKGLFVKEIEEQLLNGDIDLAVHSMKDMPSTLPDGLTFAAIPKREDPRDVLILKDGLPYGATIGTGSKRRKYQLLKLRPDLNIVSIRGNIDTRIQKIQTKDLDGIVLAAAGVIRGGLEEHITTFLSVDEVLPAPAQGALALEIRQNDETLATMIESIRDEATEIQVAAERGFLEGINGSCHIPIGAYCQLDGNQITLTGLYGNETGTLIKKTLTGTAQGARDVGLTLAKMVLKEYREYVR